jgi:NAD(P)-dependent dehydrogenase (short-subunit alcohol dehydrogenase family)
VADFTGKVALVTGASAGIGRATALAFARAGARVVVGSRNAEKCAETVALIEQAGGEASFLRTDVTVAADVEALVAHAVARFGALDFAFNNAGIFARLAPITELSNDEFDRVVATNVRGVWLSLKYELERMLAQGRGAIVNNASIGSIIGSAGGAAAYTASKHAVVGLTKCAALENVRHGVRVNAISPAVIDTGMAERFAADLGITMEQFGQAHPIGRVGTVEEVAAGVLWLCSEQASFVVGTNLVVDGGYTVP